MSSMNANKDNVRLLLAMKEHLQTEERIKKVDDAIKVMQVIQFLPLLKETGLFGGLEDILGSFKLDSLGNVLGNVTSGKGLGGLLGGSSSGGGLGGILKGLTSGGGLGGLLGLGGQNSRGGR